ncbi:hypothetical protein ACFQ48_16545 [Hymenobacter caeli]|uniref:Uncharacterized protein n=1 Tax=Hymenobacter caeli TaxID=2735894 RepID=A0ABX2FTY0_9BACT|nr:hypothetical protein [Hymenobacter caeli]NRT20648.1 hypothetical protein [Hymenobacter caeli]
MPRPARLLPLLLLVLAALGPQGCSRAHEREGSKAAVQGSALPTAAAPALDVPALLGRTIDEVHQRLGPPRALPDGFQDPVTPGPGDSTLVFRQQGLTMVVRYDAPSRRVLDLLVLGPDEDVLMRQTGLLAGNPAYLLLPVFAVNRSTRLLGLRVVPLG